MNTPVYCTSNTRLIGDPEYLYLPTGWYEKPWHKMGRRTILDIPNDPYQARLYILTHGQIWIVPKEKQYWRLNVRADYIRDYLIGVNLSTRLWMVREKHPIVAERVDYETLRLEAIFL